jgi:DNA-binding NtrC family response regulator
MNDFDSPTTTILLLDSDRDSRATLRDALESAGYLVVSGADLGEALDRLADTPPDLLVIRPYINSMPGRVAADYLRTKQHGLPVLLVAGFLKDDRTNVQTALEDFETFPAPFSGAELVVKVRDILKTQPKTALLK